MKCVCDLFLLSFQTTMYYVIFFVTQTWSEIILMFSYEFKLDKIYKCSIITSVVINTSPR